MEKKIYWSVLALIILLAGILECTPAIDGLLVADDGVLEFGLQMTMIIISLIVVYTALKLVKGKPLVRILLLAIPALANVVFYHLFVNTSFLYLAVIVLVGFAFVYPATPAEESGNEEIANKE